MRTFLAAIAAMMLLASCTTTQSRTTTSAAERPAPPPNATILVVEPDIQLSLLSAAGMQEPRADWTDAARANIASGFAANLTEQGHAPQPFDPDAATEGRIGQVIRLHEAVGASILFFQYAGLTLPTHPRDSFDWTLGPGTQEIAAASKARYALFIVGRGSYASGGRVAAMIGLAILGVGVPLGGQQMYASLVDLQTGDIIWFNLATASPNSDMRTPEGARALVDEVLADAPL